MLPSGSSMLNSSTFRMISVGSVWLCTRVFQSGHALPLFLDVYSDRGKIVLLDHVPGGWLCGCGRVLVTTACALSSLVFPHPCSAGVALTRPAPPWSVHPPSVLSLENL